MEFITGFNRDQLVMMDFESCVGLESWARTVDMFVDILPMEELGYRDVLNSEGRPPYHSSDMLKLYLYGYKNRLRSSRQMEHACKVNLEVIWLLKGLRPSARKIAYFRKDNAAAFKLAFRHFVGLLKEWELIEGATIAIDSFKIRAQNAQKNNFNQKKLDRHIAYIDDKIREYQDRLDQGDGVVGEQQIESKIAYQESKKERYRNIEKKLQESGESQISLTDPDARSVILHRNIINVGYNVQAGCDAKHKLFVNNDTGSVNDTHALSPMALDAKELLGVESLDILTDKGYTTAKHLDICTRNGITPYSSPKDHSSHHNGRYPMVDFTYDKIKDTYTCPADQVLATNGSIYDKAGHKVKHYKNRKACGACPVRALCTTNKNGRFIERSIYQEALDENQKRVEARPEYYRLRQQVTEHQFGTLKRQWGFTHTLMRGKQNVLSEVNLMMICYNLTRLMTILGPEVLKNRLKRLVPGFSALFEAILAHMNSFLLPPNTSPNFKPTRNKVLTAL
ncbi:IS1182 family transposase [Aequorivita ciconiae]|uniref:IS1182 family transposase n=1 Tax=Aequorivita ciconiae TaxID=2494375 RepID=UPI00196A6BFC|nr:IS1182 family transposase [Aequorivita sp. H23M31]